MKRLEDELMLRLNDDEQVPYPDFGAMWERMDKTVPAGPEMRGTLAAPFVRKRKVKRIAVAATLGALLVAAPVYAAIHYDLGYLLNGKSGIQAALEQNMGQTLERSVTREGITMTLRTAIVDDNRTVILYTLDAGFRPPEEFWNFKGFSLRDAEGNPIEAEVSNLLRWDLSNKRYYGILETDWTPSQDNERVQLVAEELRKYSQQEQEIKLDPASQEPQSFTIGRDGMQKIKIQPFTQGPDKMMFASTVTFDRPEVKSWTFPQIVAYRDGTEVKPLPGGTFGTPDGSGNYTSQQYFDPKAIPGGKTVFKLQYTRVERTVDGPWTFDLQLSKKQMQSGTIQTALNLPLEAGDSGSTLEKMVITPTQIRIVIRTREKYQEIPYKKYSLEVGGKTLEGPRYYSPMDPYRISLRIERPLDLKVTADTPIIFVGKHKVTVHEDKQTSFQLTGISDKKRTLETTIGGYPVTWTYYRQGADLYVETGSEDARFGGINQTYIMRGKERLLGKPLTANFTGDGNNKAIDVYKNFQGTEAEIHMFYYTIDDPEKVTRVTLRPGPTQSGSPAQ
ncbi:protein of unknown function [Paenibacillus sophorae]|uniref:DUF4179 domain-containing protein n=1 Tax=Paenibacillus sophorae TaxID=1333845 RepID=A0A1H8RA21_9BACL|nr:DUF4179 domain-containing protein [Paenibacillus sophorae]QWU15007.1 DUF4179 domain-containing protein [Paenibacillus sophorae]SEO63261.1 protein of unknown function [Paenibacillus sophorae]